MCIAAPKICNLQYHTYYLPLTVPVIKGVKFIAEKMLVVVPGKSLNYLWDKYGFEIFIPAGAFSTTKVVTLSIQASITGDYQLPNDDVLVSGVYSLSLHPAMEKFHKNVSLTIQHCASSDRSSLSFVTADSTQDTLPYIFGPLEGGIFTDSEGHGVIEVDHFSLYGVAGEDSLDYSITTYYVPKKEVPDAYVAHIAVTQNTKIVMEVRKLEWVNYANVCCSCKHLFVHTGGEKIV